MTMNTDIPVYRHSLEGERATRRPDGLCVLTHVLYALYMAGWMTGGISVLVAIITNYARRADAVGTPCEAHFTWQIRTFWISVVCVLAGVAVVLYELFTGYSFKAWASPVPELACFVLAMCLCGIWVFCRIIKGWLYLYWNKPLPHPRGWI